MTRIAVRRGRQDGNHMGEGSEYERDRYGKGPGFLIVALGLTRGCEGYEQKGKKPRVDRR